MTTSQHRGTPPKLPLFAPKIRKIGKKSNSTVFESAKNFILEIQYMGDRLATKAKNSRGMQGSRI